MVTPLVIEDTPASFKMLRDGYIDVSLTARVGTLPRSIRATYTMQVVYRPTSAGDTPPSTVTVGTRTLYYRKWSTAPTEAQNRIEGIETEVLIVPREVFFESLEQYVLAPLRGMQTENVVYRKLKLTFHISRAVGLVKGRATRASLRTYENYSFTFPTGVTGAVPGAELRVGAISYSLYPKTKVENGNDSQIVQDSSIQDKPSRFLVRGAGVPPKEVFTNENVLAFGSNYTRPIPLGVGSPWYLRPVIEVGGSLIDVRAAQCVGYVRVAGQAARNPGALVEVEGGRI